MPIRFCWLWTDHFTAGDILNLFCYAYIFKKVIFVFPVQLITILQQFNDKCFEMHFLREQFKCALMFWNTFFERAIWRALKFWNVFFEGAILKNTYFLREQLMFWNVWTTYLKFMVADSSIVKWGDQLKTTKWDIWDFMIWELKGIK